MKHGVITACRLMAEQLDGTAHRFAFVTLTYAKPGTWEPYHITEYQRSLHAWAAKRGYGLGYVWVAEIQTERARLRFEHVVHYHLMVWWWGSSPSHRLVHLPPPDGGSYRGQVMWRHGISNVKRNLRDELAWYMAKYASKGSSFGWPPGMRIWGHGGLGIAQRVELAWWRAPRWVRRMVPLEDGVKRLRCGWWGNRATRWAYRTPWRFDMQLLEPYWVGWTEHDYCTTGAAYMELGGSG